MGKRGPKPTPTTILQKRGSWRAKENSDEPLPDILRIECPEDIAASEHAKSFWDTYEEMLYACGLLTIVDYGPFCLACKVYADFKKYEEYIEENGDTWDVQDLLGNVKAVKVHPYAGLKLKCLQELNKFFSNFGMTPADRSRVIASGVGRKKANTMDKIT